MYSDKSSVSGNVLFLILIAVALFAAISYVVTQSTRSSGGVQNEKDGLVLSAFFNQALYLRSEVTRYQIDAGKPPILTRLAGGLYDPSRGVVEMYPPLELNDPTLVAPDFFFWILAEVRVRVDGTEVGSPEPDLYLILQGITQSFCEMINKKMIGTATILAADNLAPFSPYTNSGILANGINFLDSGATGSWDLLRAEGCFATAAFAGGRAVFFQVVER